MNLSQFQPWPERVPSDTSGASLILVLLRHATRSAFLPFDNGESPLNEVGLDQARTLAQYVTTGAPKQKAPPPPTRIFTSPRLRAIQTLAPLAEVANIKPQILEDLDERRNDESAENFARRIRGSLDKLTADTTPHDVVYACTHLDFLELATQLWPTDFNDLQAQAAWSTLEYQIFERNAHGVLEAKTRGRIQRQNEEST